MTFSRIWRHQGEGVYSRVSNSAQGFENREGLGKDMKHVKNVFSTRTIDDFNRKSIFSTELDVLIIDDFYKKTVFFTELDW